MSLQIFNPLDGLAMLAVVPPLVDGWTKADVAKAVVGPIISAVVAAIVALVVSLRNIRAQNRQTIDGMKSKAIELAMQYPHVESDAYCNAWPNPPGDNSTKEYRDEYERYDNYCCYVFNLIHRIWTFAGRKENKVEDMLTVREYILRHRCWWSKEDGNIKYFEQEFHNFVQSVLNDAKRKGECQ